MYQLRNSNSTKGNSHQGCVSSRQFFTHVINRCVAKCYRIILPRSMRNRLGRYRQVFLALAFFSVFSMAFFAGFITSHLRNSYESTEHSQYDLNVRKGESEQQNEPLWKNQLHIIDRRKLEKAKHYKRKRKLKSNSNSVMKPTISNHWPMPAELDANFEQVTKIVPSYTKMQNWGKGAKKFKRNDFPILTQGPKGDDNDKNRHFSDNDIGAENVEDKQPLSNEKFNADMVSAEQIKYKDSDETKSLAIAEDETDHTITQSTITRQKHIIKNIETTNRDVKTIQPQNVEVTNQNEVEKGHQIETVVEANRRGNIDEKTPSNAGQQGGTVSTVEHQEDIPSTTREQKGMGSIARHQGIASTAKYQEGIAFTARHQENIPSTVHQLIHIKDQNVEVHNKYVDKKQKTPSTPKSKTAIYASDNTKFPVEHSQRDSKGIRKNTRMPDKALYQGHESDRNERKQNIFVENEADDDEDQNDEEISPISLDNHHGATMLSSKPIPQDLEPRKQKERNVADNQDEKRTETHASNEQNYNSRDEDKKSHPISKTEKADNENSRRQSQMHDNQQYNSNITKKNNNLRDKETENEDTRKQSQIKGIHKQNTLFRDDVRQQERVDEDAARRQSQIKDSKGTNTGDDIQQERRDEKVARRQNQIKNTHNSNTEDEPQSKTADNESARRQSQIKNGHLEDTKTRDDPQQETILNEAARQSQVKDTHTQNTNRRDDPEETDNDVARRQIQNNDVNKPNSNRRNDDLEEETTDNEGARRKVRIKDAHQQDTNKRDDPEETDNDVARRQNQITDTRQQDTNSRDDQEETAVSGRQNQIKDTRQQDTNRRNHPEETDNVARRQIQNNNENKQNSNRRNDDLEEETTDNEGARRQNRIKDTHQQDTNRRDDTEETDNDVARKQNQIKDTRQQDTNSRDDPEETDNDVAGRQNQIKDTRQQDTNRRNHPEETDNDVAGRQNQIKDTRQQDTNRRNHPEETDNDVAGRQNQIKDTRQQDTNRRNHPEETDNDVAGRQNQIKDTRQQDTNRRNHPEETDNDVAGRQNQIKDTHKQDTNRRYDPEETDNNVARRQNQIKDTHKQDTNRRYDPEETDNNVARRQNQIKDTRQQDTNRRYDSEETDNDVARRQNQIEDTHQQDTNRRDNPEEQDRADGVRRQRQSKDTRQKNTSSKDDQDQETATNEAAKRQIQIEDTNQQHINTRDGPQHEKADNEAVREHQSKDTRQQNTNSKNRQDQETADNDERRQSLVKDTYQQKINNQQQERTDEQARRESQNKYEHQPHKTNDQQRNTLANEDGRQRGRPDTIQKNTDKRYEPQETFERQRRHNQFHNKQQHEPKDTAEKINAHTLMPMMPTKTRKTGFLKQLPLINMDDLEENKPKVLIVIFVLSSALRYDRRQGIRDTWWTKCKEPTAACMFVTDGYIDESLYDPLIKEKSTYNDILFLPVDEGLNFGMRLFFMMEWAQAKYNPDFFLRIDDDYFLCIERLLNELPLRPKLNVVWGFWHCDLPTVTFIDESFILLSFDLVDKFLSWDESTLLCHPFGDQQLGLWLNRLPPVRGFFDSRLHHHPPASKMSRFSRMVNICDIHLGLHGTYPEDMRKFWLKANDGKKRLTKWIHLYPKACHYRPYFRWQDIKPKFRHKPELCMKNPRWTREREMWTGRQ